MQSSVASRTQPFASAKQATSGNNRARSSARTVVKAHKVHYRSHAFLRQFVACTCTCVYNCLRIAWSFWNCSTSQSLAFCLSFDQEENVPGMDVAKRAAVAALVAAQIALPSAGAKSSDSCLCLRGTQSQHLLLLSPQPRSSTETISDARATNVNGFFQIRSSNIRPCRCLFAFMSYILLPLLISPLLHLCTN